MTATRTWTRTDGPGRAVTWTADGARVEVLPDPERPGDWRCEAHEADGVTNTLAWIGGESSPTRAGALDVARRWRRALSRPADS